MKFTTGLQILSGKNIEKDISKKILLANTSSRIMDPKALNKAVGVSNDPLYSKAANRQIWNPDIRYRNQFAFSPLTQINYRNDLLIFAENKEIKKAVKIMANEVVVTHSGDTNKYPLFPNINLTTVDIDKQNVAQAILDYLNDVFYPKLYQMLNFKKTGLVDMIKDFLITGKVAYEIIYDNLKSPKDIIGIQPIDPGCLQKFKEGENVYYVQRDSVAFGSQGGGERILSENQVILLEWNKYDYGYISYVDGLRMSFNTMRSMETSKILWFATKSQVRMHVKLALGNLSRDIAEQKLSEYRNDATNTFTFAEDGSVRFNNIPNNHGYTEYVTAETENSGHPEIEEINSNGPDLTEVDSLQYWERLFWNDTGIPYDRIDPDAGDSWGFTDVESLRKTEITFAKDIQNIRDMLEDVILKPLIIQLTLKEVEIGIDLSLLDSIKIEWVSYNQYEKMADLEILNKKIDIANNLTDFGTTTNAAGNEINMFPIEWISRNILDLTEDQLKQIEEARIREFTRLGYNADGTPKPENDIDGANTGSEETSNKKIENSSTGDEDIYGDEEYSMEETPEEIASHDDNTF